MSAPISPDEGRLNTLDQRYDGVTVTLHLTDGLTYSTATVAADVIGASVASQTAVGGSATINGVTGDAEVTISFPVDGGVSGITYDGYAFLVNGVIDAAIDFLGIDRTITLGAQQTFFMTAKHSDTVIYGG